MKTEWTRKNLSIAGGLVVSALLILPNLGKGWDALRYVLDTPPTAYAAKQQSEQMSEEFRAYLQQQKEALIEQRAYQRALNEAVQQQVPNTPAPRPTYRYWTDDTGECWRCEMRSDCEQDSNWFRCD